MTEPAILLTTAEIEVHFGIPPSTIRTWVDRGRLRAVGRQGRAMLFDMAAVQDARRTDKRKATRRATLGCGTTET